MVGLLGKEDWIYRKLPDIRCSCLFFSFCDKTLTINDLGRRKGLFGLSFHVHHWGLSKQEVKQEPGDRSLKHNRLWSDDAG